MFISSRIEAFARIVAVCTDYGPLNPNVDPMDLFYNDTIPISSSPLSFLISKIPLIPGDVKKVKDPRTFLPVFFNDVMKNGFASTEDIYLHSLPQRLPPSCEIRQAILETASYALWPGISEIMWEENLMKGFKIITLPNHTILAVVRFFSNREVLFGTFERMLSLPALDDERAWQDYQQTVSEDLTLGLLYSPILEGIRMCVAPTELKIRDNRVPSGYVSGNRKPSSRKGDIAVVYLPKTRTIYSKGENVSRGEPTGITHRSHQVTGFLRQLPPGWKPSDDARKTAVHHGFILPEGGFTFVRPHSRGTEEKKVVYKIESKERDDG
jgi:hypothetical protein